MKKQMKLKPRLQAAAEFARKGKRFADIGTDHAFLPIYLVSEEIALGGVASDINRGPVERATADIREAGLTDKIDVNLGNGLCGIDKYEPEDIYVLGMGGELISSILDAAPFIKKKGIRLILQPMTHHADTRKWILSNGFDIIGEKLVKEDGRTYQLICAEYDGRVRERDEIGLILGDYSQYDKKLLADYAGRLADVYKVMAEGQQKAGRDSADACNMAQKLMKIAADAQENLEISG